MNRHYVYLTDGNVAIYLVGDGCKPRTNYDPERWIESFARIGHAVEAVSESPATGQAINFCRLAWPERT